jgi:hypothetical protein
MDGDDLTRSASTSTGDSDDASAADTAMRAALNAIGSWRDLDWEATVEVLDRIRHESKPTPPIELQHLSTESTAQ